MWMRTCSRNVADSNKRVIDLINRRQVLDMIVQSQICTFMCVRNPWLKRSDAVTVGAGYNFPCKHETLLHYWATVCDGGPVIKQRCINVSRFMGYLYPRWLYLYRCTLSGFILFYRPDCRFRRPTDHQFMCTWWPPGWYRSYLMNPRDL